MSNLGQDLRYAYRAALATPGFTLMVVLTLALGIGANTALFSIVDAVMLRPLAFPEPQRLVRIYETFPLAGGASGTGSVSIPNFRDWQRQARSFEGLASYLVQSVNLQGLQGVHGLQGVDSPERLSALAATAGLFDLLGRRPLLGRGFAAGEDEPGARQVAVVSEGLWRRRFGADPRILERTLVLDGQAHAIVGVMPAGFEFPPGWATDVWTTLRPTADQQAARGSHMLSVIGRLRDGVGLDAAREDMRAVAAGIAQAYPDQQAGRSADVQQLQEVLVRPVRPALVVLLAATGAVLLIACANAANLLLARAAARRREIAVRTALGAGRGRLVALHLTESLLLALPGALLGLLLAWAGVRAIVVLAAERLPRASEVAIDLRAAAFLALVTLATGIAFGLAPALQSLRNDLGDDLRTGARQGGTGRAGSAFRGALVVGQIALSLVLLVCAGLLLRTFEVLLGTATGMATEGVVTLGVAVPPERYPEEGVAAARFFAPVRERVAAIPGVTAAGWTSHLPLKDWGFNGNFGIEGRPPADRPGDEPFSEYRVIGPGTFAALGVPVLEGRDLSTSDVDGAQPVAVVNRALAERYFPGESAIGKRLLMEPTVTIVGVVGDVRQTGLDAPPRPEISLPYAQVGTLPEMTLAVRTAIPPEKVLPGIRDAIRAVDPAQPVFDVRTLEEVVAGSMADRRLNLVLFGAFAALALLLALAGIYGVIAYTVGQRRREIGIRMALGARIGTVLGLVVGYGARLTLAGLALGVAASLAATRLMASLLYGVSATEPAILASVCAVLAVVALLACYLPARRAAEVEPAIVLRAE